MGDRANVQFRWGPEGSPLINLYGHWAGTNLALAVQECVATREVRDRWGDESYFTRMVIEGTLAKLGSEPGNLGYGLNPIGPDDNEHAILVLDVTGCTAHVGDASWTFHEFCKLDRALLRKVVE